MALTFTPSSTDSVDHGRNASVDNMSVGTHVALVYIAAGQTGSNIVSKWASGSQGFNRWNIDNSNRVFCTVGRATTDLRVRGDATATVDEWTWAAATWDVSGVDGDQKVYLGNLTTPFVESSTYNEQQVGSGAQDDDSSHTVVGGNLDVGTSNAWKGDIAAVMIFNRQLTLGELKHLQFDRFRGVPSGCVLWSEYGVFGGATGLGTQADLSGNGLSGTLGGTIELANHAPGKKFFLRDLGAAYIVGSGAQAVTTTLIASGSSLTAPTVAHTVDTAFIASGSSLTVPTVAHTIDTAFIASGSSITVPTVAHTVDATVITSGNVVSAPSVTNTQLVTLSTIASGSSLAVPTLAHNIDTATIASGLVISDPTVDYQVVSSAISSGSNLFALEVALASGPQAVTSATLASGSALSAPTAAYTVAGAAIASGSGLSAPTAAYVVSGATLASGAALSAPTAAYAVAGATLASGATLGAPTATYTVAGATLASGTVLSAPLVTVGALAVVGDVITSGTTIYVPTVSGGVAGIQLVTVGTVTSGSVISIPDVSYQVDIPAIASGVILYSAMRHVTSSRLGTVAAQTRDGTIAAQTRTGTVSTPQTSGVVS